MAKIIVSGSVAYDRIMDYPGLFADHILADKAHSINLSFQVDKLSVQYGGTAGNVAYSLLLLGEEPEIIASVGNDFSQYRAHLLNLGAQLDSLHSAEGDPTASAFILTDKNDNQIAAFHMGAAEHAYHTLPQTDGRLLAIVSAGCIADMMAFPAHYRQQGMRYLYDPGQAIAALSADALREGMKGAYIVFASEYEISLIQKKTNLDEQAILKDAEHLVITYGAKGSRIVSKTADEHIDAIPNVKAIDPTGAGDAYRAGFIKGLSLGLPLPACARLASTVAAFAVEKYGTQSHSFTKKEVTSRFACAYTQQIEL